MGGSCLSKEEYSPYRILEGIDPNSALDAVLFLKRSGALLFGWTRNPAPENVLTVMAATMLGSLETLVETLGRPNPQTVFVAAEDLHIVSARVGSNATLVLAAPRTVGESHLRRELQRFADLLRQDGEEGREEPSLSSPRMFAAFRESPGVARSK